MERHEFPKIIASRTTGKSATLLRLALQNHADIAVPTAFTGVYVDLATDVLHIPKEEISHDRNRHIVKIRDIEIAPVEYFRSKPEIRKPLYVDELDLALGRLLGRSINGYSLSIDDHG